MTSGTVSDMIRNMAKLQIRSVQDPVATPGASRAAVEALKLMDAMGLLEAEKDIEVLDLETVRAMAQRAASAGIGETAAVALRTRTKPQSQDVEAALETLRTALEASPVPEFEWPSLIELFGAEQLAGLVGVSMASLRRYAGGSRPTPDAVAARLHLLAQLTADLRGAYSEVGVRRWFERKRTQLDGLAPRDILKSDWDPDATGPQEVRALARSLAGASAT
jgi:transcriptional regulator with XRE-family HTH domain